MNTKSILSSALLCAALAAPAAVQAQAPSFIPFQGYLTDDAGMPITGDIEIRFRLYDTGSPSGAVEEILHEETQTVMLDEGYFTTYLGDQGAVDLGIFQDNPIVFVGLLVGDDTDELSPLIQLATAPYAAYAEAAYDSARLGGIDAADYALAADIPGETEVDNFVANNGYITAADVTWGNLNGIPADIADGDANTQLNETQVDNFVSDNGYITAADVTWGNLSGIPADIANGDANTQLNESQVDAFVANNGYATTSDITWANLSGIPADIANGDANTTYGTIANGGLRSSGTNFGLASCATGQVLKATGSGTWGCAADNDTDTNTTYGTISSGGLRASGTSFGLTSCSTGQVMKATGSGTWGCAADDDAGMSQSEADDRYIRQGSRSFGISPAGFTPAQGTDANVTFQAAGTLVVSGGAWISTPISLEAGATVTQIKCIVANGSGEGSLYFGHRAFGNGLFQVSEYLLQNEGQALGMSAASLSVSGSQLIGAGANGDFHYLSLNFSASATLYGCQVHYTR